MDHDLALLAAMGMRDCRPWYADKLGANETLTEVIELLLTQTFPRQSQLQDRNRGSVVGDDERRRGAGWELFELRLRYSGYLRDGAREICMRLKEDFDHTGSFHRLRFDVLDIVDSGGEGALGDIDDAVGHVFR